MRKPTVIGFIPKKTVKKNDKKVETEKTEEPKIEKTEE